MTRPGIEPRNPGPLVNTLTIMPMWFGLVRFYGRSTNVVYLRLNPFYTYILNMISKPFLLITFLTKPELIVLAYSQMF